ncbi:hypothetical protein G5S35_30900 [Paraburkholderia tropica]|uniref:hypothetical protein n=1 Tax=Paraburkholderia tropica TaxID=92647 RepID=UPI001601987E|nr:hypothetical protein [Paraburkholderia tropica]QNB16078.1 hypothetical protein G5S35_30900 [Paraburkholderia tropica]
MHATAQRLDALVEAGKALVGKLREEFAPMRRQRHGRRRSGAATQFIEVTGFGDASQIGSRFSDTLA